MFGKVFVALLIITTSLCHLTFAQGKFLDISIPMHLKALMQSIKHSKVWMALPLDELPTTSVSSPHQKVMSGFAYIPLSKQPLHDSYGKDGFPELGKMMQLPKPRFGIQSYPAIPSLEPNANEIYILDRPTVSSEIFHPIIKQLCYEFKRPCSLLPRDYRVLSCHLKSSTNTTTDLLDMLGYVAQQMQGGVEDVYWEASVPTPSIKSSSTNRDAFTISYEDEKIHPRIMWPAWVNMYILFRTSYHTCISVKHCDGSNKDNCANFFIDIRQLSLTYAYFVCRYLSGNAADALCPGSCREEPCNHMRNAIPDTCHPTNLKIHNFDFFCFCEEGYVWENKEERDLLGVWRSGRCTQQPAGPKVGLEPCTPLEMVTFCNLTGTDSCMVNRSGSNRRGICKCKDGFENLDCSFKPSNACEISGFAGYLRCRVNEGNGICYAATLTNYTCKCLAKNYIRWLEHGYEECIQWVPGIWHDRSERCGYLSEVLPDKLHNHCNSVGCSVSKLKKYFSKIENSGHSCGGMGQCMPLLNGSADLNRDSTYCLCKPGYAGNKCSRFYAAFVEWTPWTVCYDKGLVHKAQRGKLRFRNCVELKRNQEGLPPDCVGGQNETATCPDVASHLKDRLSHSDYIFAAQAVISMWRVVELILFADLVLVGLLAGVLLHHRISMGRWGQTPGTNADKNITT